MKQPERVIEIEILEFLHARDIFCFKVKSQGTYDPVKKTFRRPNKYFVPGTSDILGVFNGRALAIEVKTKTGRASEFQKTFLRRFNEAGGLGFIARSVDEVILAMGL